MSSRNWFAVSIIPDGRNETVEGWRYYESEPPEQGAVIEIQTDPANAIGPITRIQVEVTAVDADGHIKARYVTGG